MSLLKNILSKFFSKDIKNSKYEYVFMTSNEFPESNKEFREEFDKHLDLCEFDNDTELGFLFFMGAVLPSLIDQKLLAKDRISYLKILSSYSKSTGDFADYGELNDSPFHFWIYNINVLIHSISKSLKPFKEQLRKVSLPSGNTMIIGETPIDEDFQNKFKDAEMDLNLCQNILDAFFKKLGKELSDKEFSRIRAYEAGFAYRMMQTSLDLNGIEIMLKSIYRICTPLYQSLLIMPELFVLNQPAFCANHLFSHVLNNFYGGQYSPLFQFSEAIHKYHQYVFYKPGTIELRDDWNFARNTNKGSAVQVFLNAMHINKVKFDKDYSTIIKKSGEVYAKDIIDKVINRDTLLSKVLSVLENKYDINGLYEFTEEGAQKSDWLDNGNWNHKGDDIQFLVILWYETCLHTLAVKEIKN